MKMRGYRSSAAGYICCLLVAWLVCSPLPVWGGGLAISGGTNSYTVFSGAVITIDDSLTISGIDIAIDSARVMIRNLQAGDTLGYPSTLHDVAGNYDAGTGVLTLNGTTTAANFQEILRTITFSTTSADMSPREIDFALGAGLMYEGTGHFYEFVDGTYTWTQAKDAATNRWLFGRQGYLATIMSEGENDFIADKLASDGWVGARDINRNLETGAFLSGGLADGDWRWVTGPEGTNDNGSGTKFFSGYHNHGASEVDGMYSNWDSGEPNDWTNETFTEGEWVVHMWGTGARAGTWNDYHPTDQTVGYVVEYGGMPDDEPVTVSGTKVIEMLKASQEITFEPIAGPQPWTATNGLVATAAPSGLTVEFVVVDGPGALASPTSLTFTDAGNVVVVATQPGNVNYAAAPAVTNVVKVYRVMPDNGPLAGGNLVTVTNAYSGVVTNVFLGTPGSSPATITEHGESWFTVEMPGADAAGPVDIVLQTSDDGEITLADAYTYNPAGVITGVTPSSGSWTGGYHVVISGENLSDWSDPTDLSDVTLVGVSVSNIVSHSSTEIEVVSGTLPYGVPVGDVVVYSSSYGVTTLADGFEYEREEPWLISTLEPAEVRPTMAVSGGDVLSDNGLAVSVRGVVWSSSTTEPTLETNDGFSRDGGSGIGSFYSTIEGLTPGGTYHVRAYATNEKGTGYGPTQTFTTPAEIPAGPALSYFTIEGVTLTVTAQRSGYHANAYTFAVTPAEEPEGTPVRVAKTDDAFAVYARAGTATHQQIATALAANDYIASATVSHGSSAVLSLPQVELESTGLQAAFFQEAEPGEDSEDTFGAFRISDYGTVWESGNYWYRGYIFEVSQETEVTHLISAVTSAGDANVVLYEAQRSGDRVQGKTLLGYVTNVPGADEQVATPMLLADGTSGSYTLQTDVLYLLAQCALGDGRHIYVNNLEVEDLEGHPRIKEGTWEPRTSNSIRWNNTGDQHFLKDRDHHDYHGAMPNIGFSFESTVDFPLMQTQQGSLDDDQLTFNALLQQTDQSVINAGEETSLFIEYHTEPDVENGVLAAATPAISTNDNTVFSHTITMVDGQVYYYRGVAVNERGRASSDIWRVGQTSSGDFHFDPGTVIRVTGDNTRIGTRVRFNGAADSVSTSWDNTGDGTMTVDYVGGVTTFGQIRTAINHSGDGLQAILLSGDDAAVPERSTGFMAEGYLQLTIMAQNLTKEIHEDVSDTLDYTVVGLDNPPGLPEHSVASVEIDSAGAPAFAFGGSVADSPFPITVTNAQGSGLDNYDVQYVDGLLTVLPAEASAFVFTEAPATTGTGEPTSFTIQTVDAYGNVSVEHEGFTDILTVTGEAAFAAVHDQVDFPAPPHDADPFDADHATHSFDTGYRLAGTYTQTVAAAGMTSAVHVVTVEPTIFWHAITNTSVTYMEPYYQLLYAYDPASGPVFDYAATGLPPGLSVGPRFNMIDTIAGNGDATYDAGHEHGVATDAAIGEPRGVVVASDGSVYIADSANARVWKRTPDGNIATVFTLVGSSPFGLAVNDDYVFVADAAHSSVYQLDRSNAYADVTLIDNGLLNPSGLALNGDDLYIADTGNHRVRVYDLDTAALTTVAGTGSAGYNGDDIAATTAQLNAPADIALDEAGNVYIADTDNHRIRRFDVSTGEITTFAGTGVGGFSGDGGPATGAQLQAPSGIAVDSAGRILIADSLNHRLRLIRSDGNIETVAGDGTSGFTGDGGDAADARMQNPGGIAIGSDMRIYVADTGNHRVRHVYLSVAVLSGNPEDVNTDGSGNLIPYPITLHADLSNGYGADYLFALDVQPKALTVIDAEAADKTYDATTGAVVSGATLSGIASPGGDLDDVSLTNGTTGVFAQNGVGTNIVVSTSMGLTGDHTYRYTLVQPDLAADITPRAVTYVVTPGQGKVYGDADDNAELTGAVHDSAGDGLVPGHAFTTGSLVRVAGEAVGSYAINQGTLAILDGDLADVTENYDLTFSGDDFTITARTLNITFAGVDREYDGSTNATVTASDDRIAGDMFTINRTAYFQDKHVEENKPVDISGVSLSGSDAGNYALSYNALSSADITARTLDITFTGENRVYDGSTNATVTAIDNRVDDDSFTIHRTAHFQDKHVGEDKPVDLSGVSLSGEDAGNYTLSYNTAITADITARTLDITFTGVDRVYDGGTNATVTASDDRVDGDVFEIARTAFFRDKHVGEDKPVDLSGVSLSGVDAGNYTLSFDAESTADITARTLTLTNFVADSKAYDDTVAVSGAGFEDDRLEGDELTFIYDVAFEDKHVGEDKDVLFTNIAIDGGADQHNYVLATVTGTATASITPSELGSFTVTGIASPLIAGTSSSVEVRALDTFGNLKHDYVGTISFSSSDAAAGLPADYTFTEADGGVATISGVVLQTAGTQSVSVTATPGTETGSQTGIEVQASAVTHLTIEGDNTQIAGDQQEVTVSALDSFGNIATAYDGTRYVVFSGANPTLDKGLPAYIENVHGDKTDFGTEKSVQFEEGQWSTGMTLLRVELAQVHVVASDAPGSGGTVYTSDGHDLDVDVLASAVAKLLWVGQPAASVKVAETWPAVSLEITDAFGNRRVDATNEVALGSSPVLTFSSGTFMAVPADGLVVFDDIVSAQAASSVTLVASAPGLASSSASDAFDVLKGDTSLVQAPEAAPITFGQLLSDATLTSGEASLPGTFAFTNPDTMPDATQDGTQDEYEVTFTPDDADNYAGFTLMVPVTVAKADALITVSGISVVYDGNTHGATGDAMGADDSDLSGLLDTGDSFIDVPGGTALWNFPGDANHNAASGSVEIVISEAEADVALDNLAHVFDGAVKSATATTDPAGLSVNILYDPADPVNVGSYAVTATVEENNYIGSTTGTLVIVKGTAEVTLTNLVQVYDGEVKEVTYQTDPSDLTVDLSYGGSVWAPTNAGSYEVIATVNDANWQGSVTGTLVVARAAQVISDFEPDDESIFDVQETPVLRATALSGLPVSFSVASGPATINGGTNLTFAGVNEVRVIATQEGDSNWQAAEPVTNTYYVGGGLLEVLGVDGELLGSDAAPSSASGTSYGIVYTNEVAVSMLSITNAGTAPLTIKAVTASGSEYFSITDMPDVVAYGTVSNFWVRYQPETSGAHQAEFTIESNGYPDTFVLRTVGTGILPGEIWLDKAYLSYETYFGDTNLLMDTYLMTNRGETAFWYTNEVSPAVAEDWFTILPVDGEMDPAALQWHTGTVSVAGMDAGRYFVTNTITGTAINAPVDMLVELNIQRAAQTIDFAQLAPQPWTATNALLANATSGLTVEFEVADGPGVLDGSMLSYTDAGDVYVVAAQTGNVNYAAAPAVTNVVKVFRVTPDRGPLAGGNMVTVTNGYFGAVTNVFLGTPVSSPATITEHDNRSFTIEMPAATNAGVVDIVVQTSDNGEITLADAYTYNPAGVITGVAPVSGSWTGAYEVVISGENLSDPSDLTDLSDVMLGGVRVSSIVSHSSTEVVVVAGESTAGALSGDVVVDSRSYGVTTWADAFTYLREEQAALALELPSQFVYGTTNALSVTGGSGDGAVSYTVLSGPGDITNGTNLVATAGAGTIEIRATKAETAFYYEASVTNTVEAVPVDLVVTADDLNITAGDAITFYWQITDGALVPGDAIGDVFAGSIFSYTGTVAGVYAITNSTLTVTNANYVLVDFVDGTLTISHADATQLAFTTQPSGSTVAGEVFAQQPVVTVRDAFGNTVTNATLDVTLALTAGTGDLSGTNTVSAVSGVAPFQGLRIDRTGDDKVLTASADGVSDAVSDVFEITHAVATSMTMEGPASVIAGTGVGAFLLRTFDVFDNPAAVAQETVFDLSTTADGVFTFSGSAVSGETVLTLPAGSNQVAFGYADHEPGEKVITATWSSGGSDLGSESDDVLVAGLLVGTNGEVMHYDESASLAKGSDFGQVPVAESVVRTFGITNMLDTAITGITWATNGPGAGKFDVLEMPTVVAPGAVSNLVVRFAPALEAGAFSATLEIVSGGALVATNFLHLAGEGITGSIALSSANFGFSATYGGGNPADQVMIVSNAGVGPFVFDLSTDAPWLEASPVSGAVEPGDSMAVDLVVDITGLHAGSYTGLITVASASAANTPQTAEAVLSVERAAQTISFTDPGDQFWTNSVVLSATAESGLAVDYAVDSGADIASISTNGTTNLTFSGYGAVSIVASQAGNTNWLAASSVTNTFDVVGPELAVLGTNGALVVSDNLVDTADGTDFGSALVGLETVTNVFAVTNAGTGLLTFSSVETNGTESTSFSLVDVPETVAAGTSAVFSVVFDPQVGGTNAAAFVFGFDGTNAPYSVHVAGVGLGGGIGFSTNALSVTGTYYGPDPSEEVLSLRNIGVPGFTWTNTIAYCDVATDWLTVTPSNGVLGVDGQMSLTNTVALTNLYAGTYFATNFIWAADATNSPQSYVVQLAVVQAPQTIAFDPIVLPQPWTATNELVANATSGLDVQFEVIDGPGVLTSPSSPTSLTYTDAGDVFVVLTQTGNANWLAAPSVTNVVKVFRVTPNHGPLAGGNVVTVTNGYFGAVTNVYLGTPGSSPATITEQDNRSFTIEMPGATNAGVVDIVVQTSDNGEIPLPNAYTYNPAGVITNVAPVSGSWTGGYHVVISGENLSDPSDLSDLSDVTLGGVRASSIVSHSSTEVVVVAGESALGALVGDVVVDSTSHGVTTLADAFVYTAPEMLVLGTNTAVVINSGDPPSSEAGTQYGPLSSDAGWVTHTFAITNSGMGPLKLDGWVIWGDAPSRYSVIEKPAVVAAGDAGIFDVRFDVRGDDGHYSALLFIDHDDPYQESPYVINLMGVVDNTPPVIEILDQIIGADTNAADAAYVDMVVEVTDASEVVATEGTTFRDYGSFAGYYSNGLWHVEGIPLYDGPNEIRIIATDEAGNTRTRVVRHTISDVLYESMLRSGQIVTHIDFPDNLIPGTVTNVFWSVLSYVPVRSGIFAGVNGGANPWQYFRNGIYTGHVDSNWRIRSEALPGARHARIYSFACEWPVPQKSGEFVIAFLHAQMDGALYMSAVVPDDVDPLSRNVAGHSKLIRRNIQPGGDGSDPESEDPWFDADRVFEFLPDSQRRSGGTITHIDMPTNLVAGAQATARWRVISYMPIRSAFHIVDVEQSRFFTNDADHGIAGVPSGTVDSNWRFTVGNQTHFAKEYSFTAHFTVPVDAAGTNQIYFLHQDMETVNAPWMSGNIDAGVDDFTREYDGIYGRFIERTIADPVPVP